MLEAADVGGERHLTPGSCSVRLDRALGATEARVQGAGCCGWTGGQEEKGLVGAVQGPAPVCLVSQGFPLNSPLIPENQG